MDIHSLTDIRALIADDAFAASFQSLGQYRTALLAALAQPEPQRPTDEELRELRRFHQWPIGEFLLFTISRAVLARWGNR